MGPTSGSAGVGGGLHQTPEENDELELFGWRAEDTSRYVRQALKALPFAAVIDLFRELVAEERSYYAHDAPLADDQLDHTLIAA